MTDFVLAQDTTEPLLVSISELRIWAQDATIASDDPFANAILYAASEAVRVAAGQPTWDVTTSPPRARLICAHLAARSYKNPDSIQTEGALGALGGDRYVQELAMALHLTQAERDELASLGGGPARPGGSGGLWVQAVNSTPDLGDGDVYLADDSGSDWMIPYLHEDDVRALG